MSVADVLLVTSWNTACGIAEHSAGLVDAIHTQSYLQIQPSAEALDPHAVPGSGFPIIHLNYQASLHSRWTPEWVHHQQAAGRKVIVTFHDTGVPNSDLAKDLCAVADAFIIHEPADDLPGAIYWRMGVAGGTGARLFGTKDWNPDDDADQHGECFKAYEAQPVLGTIGFPFPWKNYDSLAQITGELGWALVLLAPHATPAQVDTWRRLNPYSWIRTDFVPRVQAQQILTGCDATAFCYVCHNTGQSAAILQGIAARKPVIALPTCRQFRALFGDPLAKTAINWCETFDDVKFALSHFVRIERCSPAIVALAEQESNRKAGQRYIDLYRRLLA